MKYARLAILVIASANCSDSTGPLAERIAVSPSIVILEQGDSVKLVASVLSADGGVIPGVPVSFELEDSGIASITSDGTVKASGAAGSTHVIVTASSEGLTAQVPVTVVAVGMTLELTPDSTVMGQRDSLQLTARILDRVGNEIIGAQISFFSSNGYVGVSSTGLVTTAGGYGTATITAFGGGLSAEAIVVVTQTPTSLQVPPGRFVVGAGDTAQLGAQVLDWGGAPIVGAAINYVSSNPGLVTVDPTGLLTASAALGSTTLVLTSDTLTRIVDVSVVPRILPQATANVSGLPYGAAISPSGVIYVVTLTGNLERATVGNFNFATAIQGLGNSRVVAFNAAGDQAYVTGEPVAGVAFIDVAADSVTDDMGGLPGIPFDLAVGSDGTIYLSTHSTLFSIDPLTHTVIHSSTTQSSGHLAVHPSQPLLYLSAQQFGVVLEFNSATLAFVRQFIGAGSPIQDAVVSPDGNTLYVTDESSGLIAAVDLGSGQTSYLEAGCAGWSLLMNPAGTQLYVGCPLQGKVNLLDLGSGQIVGTIRIAQPRHMAISPDGLSVVIPSQDGQVVLLQ